MPSDPALRAAYEYLGSRELAKAAAECDRVIRRDSRNANALALRGIIASLQGEGADAAAWLGKAIKAQPGRWDLYYDAGVVLLRLGKLAEAELRFRKAATLNPDAAEAHKQLATLFAEQGRSDDAIASYQRAVAVAPEDAATRTKLADLLHTLHRTEEAATHYEAALAIDDSLADAWYGLGHLQLSAKANGAAAASFRRHVALDATSLRGWFGLGCAELARDYYAHAAEAFRRCVELDSAYAEAYQNLGQALFNLGGVEVAIEHFRAAARHAVGRPDEEQLVELALRSIAVVIPGSPLATHADVRDARGAWGAMQTAVPVRDWSTASVAPGPDVAEPEPKRRRLRVGYVSAFFGHDNWMKPVWGLLNEHDRDRVHVHLFSDGPLAKASSTEDGAGLPPAYRRGADDVLCELTGLDNDAAAACIAEYDLDVLVDLNGYSRMNRLAVFARRPARKIAAWFNQFATTGVPWFNYLIGDDHVIHQDEEPFYTEQVLRVAGSYLTFSVDYVVPDVAPPPCLTNGCITFGSFCSQYKLTDGVLATWGEILRNCPAARLLVKNRALGVEEHRRQLIERLERFGVQEERIELRGPDDHFDFLKCYGEIDIALDVFPYNGGTTTTEAIWQGVPVVAFDGDRWAARTSATLLREAGLADWVADDREGYVRLATAWGTDADAPARLASLRSMMRQTLRGARVCDARSFARAMEDLYQTIAAER